MDTVHDAGRRLMDVALVRDVWDELPMLGFYTHRPGGDDGILTLTLVQGHPIAYLKALTDFNAQHPFPAEFELLGLVLFTEGWGLIPTEDNVDYLNSGGKPADHPDGFEVKNVTSYDGHEVKTWSLVRGETEATETISDGRLVTALQDLFASLREAQTRRVSEGG